MTKLFNDKGFWKNVVKLATPIALQNILISSFTLADTLFVSQLGDISLSAVGMMGQWNWLLNMIIFGISAGASVFVAQYWGIKAKKKINLTCGIAVTSAVLLSLAFMTLSLAAPSLVVKIFNGTEAVVKEGTAYLTIVAFSFPAVALNNVLSAVLRSVERVKLPMYASLITTIVNIFLDYSMIFGKFGFHAMGIRGAALATTISAWLGVFIILIISIIEKNVLIAPLKDTFGFNFFELKVFFKKALPVMFNESLWGFGTFIFNIIFGHMGYEHFAALTILRSFENIAFVLFIGICNACCIMVGKSIGKGKIERGIDDSKRFAILVPCLGFLVAILVFTFRPQLIGIFNMSNNISEVTLKTAMAIMAIYAFEFTIRNVPYIMIVGIFRSGGDTFTGVKYDLFCLWCLSLPATAIAVYVFNASFPVAFAIMYLFEDYIKTILCIRHYRKLKWIKPVTEEGVAGFNEYMTARGEKNGA